MPKIYLETQIKADVQTVFDLARSIDLHKVSTAHTMEEAIAGKTSGLISMNETVTWKARHFGFWHKLTSKITAFESPFFFTDEMVEGIFSYFKHEHIFEEKGGITVMKDVFDYKSPLGIFGSFADWLFLRGYMESFLEKLNNTIKEFAESNRWKTILES